MMIIVAVAAIAMISFTPVVVCRIEGIPGIIVGLLVAYGSIGMGRYEHMRLIVAVFAENPAEKEKFSKEAPE